MIDIVLPATLADWLSVMVALATLLIGLGFFLLPRTVLGRLGIAGAASHPEAIGEGRSSFAGFLIGLPASALLFGQPDIHAVIGLAWLLACIGKLANIAIDGARSRSALVRLALAALLSGLAIQEYGIPQFSLTLPQLRGDWLIFAIAAITGLFGLICLLFPGASLSIMRLGGNDRAASGEVRGGLAGFYLATGFAVLGGGSVLLTLALGVCWIVTGFGRMIAMLFDGANNLFNWLSLVFELALGGLIIAVVFGIVA